MKKTTLYISGILIATVGIIYAIRQSNYYKSKKIPDSFRTIKPSSGNNFLRFDTIPSNYTKKVPGANMFVVRIFKDSNQVTGTYTATGVFSVMDSNRILFKTIQNQYLDIYTGVPNGMYLSKVNNLKGVINSIYNSAPNGANEFFQLLSNKKLVIGHIWRTNPSPIIFAAPGGFSIQQTALYPLPTKNSINNSEVRISADSGILKIKAGEVKRFSKGGTHYSVFIQTSIYHKITDLGEDATNGYVLHAIIVQE